MQWCMLPTILLKIGQAPLEGKQLQDEGQDVTLELGPVTEEVMPPEQLPHIMGLYLEDVFGDSLGSSLLRNRHQNKHQRRSQMLEGPVMAAEGVESTPMPPVAQSRMENFRKVKTSVEDSPLPFPDLAPGVVEMKVKEGSKIRNLMGFAMARMELKGTRQIVFSGCGRAVTKTITCVEIMKRKLGGLHQVTKVCYKTLMEVWENKDPQPGGQVEKLTVHKNVPSICILLSKEPLDPSEMGYQPPEPRDGLWASEGGIEEDRLNSSPKGVKRPLAPPHGELANKKTQVQVTESQKGLGTVDWTIITDSPPEN